MKNWSFGLMSAGITKSPVQFPAWSGVNVTEVRTFEGSGVGRLRPKTVATPPLHCVPETVTCDPGGPASVEKDMEMMGGGVCAPAPIAPTASVAAEAAATSAPAI